MYLLATKLPRPLTEDFSPCHIDLSHSSGLLDFCDRSQHLQRSHFKQVPEWMPDSPPVYGCQILVRARVGGPFQLPACVLKRCDELLSVSVIQRWFSYSLRVSYRQAFMWKLSWLSVQWLYLVSPSVLMPVTHCHWLSGWTPNQAQLRSVSHCLLNNGHTCLSVILVLNLPYFAVLQTSFLSFLSYILNCNFNHKKSPTP